MLPFLSSMYTCSFKILIRNDGITNNNVSEAEIKQQMLLQSARQCVIVADGSNVGRIELAFLYDIHEIDLLILDNSADPATWNAWRECGLQVMLAQ